MKNLGMKTIGLLAAAALLACGASQKKDPTQADVKREIESASGLQQRAPVPRQEAYVPLEAQGGAAVDGYLVFWQESADEGPVQVLVRVKGLPEGAHAMHIHEGPSCANPGSFFNPADAPPGAFFAPERHAGALESLISDAEGNVETEIGSEGLTLGQGDGYIVGRTLVIYENDNDFETDPEGGNLGQPLACGVIQPGNLPPER